MQRVRLLSPLVAGLAAISLLMVSAGAAQGAGYGAPSSNPLLNGGYNDPICVSHSSLCLDTIDNPPGEYVGHDEPSIAFKSGVPGTGNNITYKMTLPKEPSAQPNASGAGGTTWNFQLRATHWFGLPMCDTQSAPEYTQICKPDSDANNLVGTNPAAADYIGKHPGIAYMELQFYPPGWVEQFTGSDCTATQYCAAMTIDSRTLDENTGVLNTSACDNYILGGQEPVNWAYVTRSGLSQAPANPLFTGTFANPNFAAVNPDPTKDLMMNPGDQIIVHMHDTADGFQVNLVDVNTGQTGSMTASTANGFGHIVFTPHSHVCHVKPYAFHPAYSTANPAGTTWSAHTYNVAMSDEIGHFESCQAVDANFNCTTPGAEDQSTGQDSDDLGACIPASFSALVPIAGCIGADEDFDGQPYQLDWPGTDPNPVTDAMNHPTPVMFTSPLANDATTQYSHVVFETDLPRIEASDSQANPPFCDRTTGTDCVNPPAGAAFYPFFSTTTQGGTCMWQEGGDHIPGTVNDFGGNSTKEFGPLFTLVAPNTGFTIRKVIDDFNSGVLRNPCPVGS